MSSPEINSTGLSLAEAKALVAEMENAASSAAIEEGRPFLTTLVRNNTVGKLYASDNSTTQGFKTDLTINVDGTQFVVEVKFVDVAASKVAKEAKELQQLLVKHGAALSALMGTQAAPAEAPAEG